HHFAPHRLLPLTFSLYHPPPPPHSPLFPSTPLSRSAGCPPTASPASFKSAAATFTALNFSRLSLPLSSWAATYDFDSNSASWFLDRKSTRLNSSHVKISYAVFCLKKKKKIRNTTRTH